MDETNQIFERDTSTVQSESHHPDFADIFLPDRLQFHRSSQEGKTIGRGDQPGV
ncbi:hypothetical protein PZB72_27060 [Catalinimonas niigatensis]|nr:hypothetical protein [Catalinimonas niigatensis]WPP50331.1 hypothetical protein PZB72_27060 [Catalinimonas niigatensis]